VLDGVVRHADVGLLYDPCREGERELCARWKAALGALAPRLRVRLNYPYAGKGDGVTRMMRKRYAPRTYIGVELEVNQGVVLAGGPAWPALRAVLIESLRDASRPLLIARRRPRTPPAHASRARRASAGGHD
jgi:predicted N-formylglutamate amidohydrolase